MYRGMSNVFCQLTEFELQNLGTISEKNTIFKDFFVIFGFFLKIFIISSAKNFRRRIFHDPWGGHIVKYRNLRPPYPPKKVRRLLWTAP